MILPLLVLKEFTYSSFVANGAFNTPIRDPERGITGTVGFGLGRAVTRKVAVMMELRGESTFDLKRDRVALLNAGLIHGVRTSWCTARSDGAFFQTMAPRTPISAWA